MTGPFFTPEQPTADNAYPHGFIPQGRLLIASCRSGKQLAEQVALRYRALSREAGGSGEVKTLHAIDRGFSDSETAVRLDRDISGHDVFLFQALHDPTSGRGVDSNYMAFLIAARAFREWGANRITGVLPYLAYARQDKPTRFEREPTSVKLMADLSTSAGIDRLMTWHPHTRQLHGFYGKTPVHVLAAGSLFREVFARFEGRDDVIVVAPDAGASKFVIHFSRLMNLNSAIASKFRPRPEQAEVSEVIGDFRGKRIALVLDDMISSGGTIEALAYNLVEKGIEEIYLGISHNLCSQSALNRLMKLHAGYNLREMVTTNSIPQTESFCALPFITVKDLSDVLARVINRVHFNHDFDDDLSY